jgi:type I restriction enzyme S subunit
MTNRTEAVETFLPSINKAELPSTWEFVPIGSICSPVSKTNPKDKPDKSFEYIDISSIDNKSYKITKTKHYVGREAPSRARQLVHTGDIVFSTVRTYLKNFARVNESLDGQIASTGFCVLRPALPVLSKYIYYLIQSQPFLNELAKLQRGTSYPAVRDADVNAQLIPVPSGDLIPRIVNEIEKQFTRLDAAIAALKRTRDNLKKYRASLLKTACEGKLVPTEAELAKAEGRDYESADNLLESILKERRKKWEQDQLAQMKAKVKTPKDDNWKKKYNEPEGPDISQLPELPEGWVWANLSQISWHSCYGTSAKCDYNASGPPVLRIPNIDNGSIVLKDIKNAKDKSKLKNLKPLEPGDFLIIRTNGSRSLIGRGALITNEIPSSYYFASYLIRYRLVNPETFQKWVITLWHNHHVRSLIEKKAATSAGQYNINIGILDNVPIPIPPLAEENRIINEIDTRITISAKLEKIIEDCLKRSEILRQAILSKAFKGQLVPQDPNDEPAEKFLERIRNERAEAQKNNSKKFSRKRERQKTKPLKG